SAREDLADIIGFIAEHNPQAARRMAVTIESSVLPAAEHPYLFRAGREPGTHEIVAHPNYIVVYRVTSTVIEVVAVVHARQQYPKRDE
ncbi:type II toxin-antitoxin system RelE/ParE family toxin, partial [Pseudomonas sp. Snoq117.2]|uniref:type II toxin-antitoxin system RelE/ParE family toxin n=2 Tax=Pseudomonadota TaxID=1224 RepID=UPI0008D3331E